jgi:hypothetical protein
MSLAVGIKLTVFERLILFRRETGRPAAAAPGGPVSEASPIQFNARRMRYAQDRYAVTEVTSFLEVREVPILTDSLALERGGKAEAAKKESKKTAARAASRAASGDKTSVDQCLANCIAMRKEDQHE